MNPFVRKLLVSVGTLAVVMGFFWWYRHATPAPAQVVVSGASADPGRRTEASPAGPPARVALQPESRPMGGPQAPAGATSVTVSDPPVDPDQARAWARQDPAAATLWLQQAGPGERRDAVLEIVCAEVARFDPGEAVALAQRFGSSNVNLLENLVYQWAGQSEATAAAYALAMPPGIVRNRLLGRIALVQAHTRPAEAAQLVVEQIGPGPVQSEAVISVLHEWARQDPAAARAWILRFPEGELRDRAQQEMETLTPR